MTKTSTLETERALLRAQEEAAAQAQAQAQAEAEAAAAAQAEDTCVPDPIFNP